MTGTHMPALFLTGASGFIGRHLLRRLRDAGVPSVLALTRHPAALAERVPPLATWRYIEGALEKPESYRASLDEVKTIVHLAAMTGKARPQQYRQVNVEGTKQLLAEADAAGIDWFIHASSIAARFQDQRYYHYATTKAEAESLVKASPLKYIIVRPTLVLGHRSPVERGLARLACGPVAVIPGKGRHLVQPIHVDDLCRLLNGIIRDPGPLLNATIELGGPDIVPMAHLLARLRARAGKPPGPVIRLPLAILRALLAAVEPVLYPVLPLTAGQLAAFANEMTAAPHPATAPLMTDMASLDVMLGAD